MPAFNIEGVGKVNFPDDYTPERIKFAIENDILPRVKAEKPAAVSIGDQLRQSPRQVGLAARYGAEGLADTAGIVTEPIRMAVNPLLRAAGLPTAPSTRGMVSGALDAVGVPSPETPNERVVGDASRMVAGAGGLAGLAGKVSSILTGTPKVVAQGLAANPGLQTVSAAGSGAAGGAVREAGGGAGEQFAASLVGGLSTAGLASLATKAYNQLSGIVKNMAGAKVGPQEVNIVLSEILEKNGLKLEQVPAEVRNGLSAEVKRALDTGSEIRPDVIRRIADYGMVGATPTRGTTTLDPVLITQEKNLAKMGANSLDPRLQELSRVQNANNGAFIQRLNDLGAGTKNADPLTAGTAATGAVKARDAGARSVENALYSKARDTQGRAIDLDREGFIFDAYKRLGESNKSAFLPAEIKSLLEQIRAGTVKVAEGQEVPVPFNVDVIDNLKTTLAAASRASKDGNTRAAISEVRNALENAQPKAVGRQVGGNQVVDPAKLAAAQTQADTVSAESMQAFDQARRFARARRQWQESAEGIKAALDDVPPDRFVQDFIISNSNKAATAEVEKLLFTIKKDPAAQQAVKENVVAFLKGKALSGAADEVGNFSPTGFNNAMKSIGDAKLKLFFSADELAQLKALGRVASYDKVQPTGSAVNNSNTAGGVAGLLDRIASSPLVGKLPFGDAAVRQPARNWQVQIGTEKALSPISEITKRQQPQETFRLSDMVGPGLLLSAPRANGSDNEKRR